MGPIAALLHPRTLRARYSCNKLYLAVPRSLSRALSRALSILCPFSCVCCVPPALATHSYVNHLTLLLAVLSVARCCLAVSRSVSCASFCLTPSCSVLCSLRLSHCPSLSVSHSIPPGPRPSPVFRALCPPLFLPPCTSCRLFLSVLNERCLNISFRGLAAATFRLDSARIYKYNGILEKRKN